MSKKVIDYKYCKTQHNTEEDERKKLKPKDNFLTPLGPLGERPYRFEKKIVSDLAVCRSYLTHLRRETQ